MHLPFVRRPVSSDPAVGDDQSPPSRRHRSAAINLFEGTYTIPFITSTRESFGMTTAASKVNSEFVRDVNKAQIE